MSNLILKNVNKIFPNGVHAVKDVNLDITDGEFIVLVGPSGCGKTTTLRMIAGLESISSGTLELDDEILNDKAPKDRDMAMVFQNYALYAHMTVYHNMAFSLTLRKENSDIIHQRVMNAAKILELVPYLNRRPKALSGGQRQRVALGRAIVRDPSCFLLDEPLSNLDAKLRGSMRKELTKLHRLLGATMIYVTHDQTEAMTLADRIVVMKDGYIQQVGSPKDIYDFPNNIFVGGFIGTPPMNFLEGRVTEKGFFEVGDHKLGLSRLKVPANMMEYLKEQKYIDKPIILGIRPENIHDEAEKIEQFQDSKVKVKVDVAELLGAETLINAVLHGQNLVAKVGARVDVHMGDEIELAFAMDKCHFFDPETEQRIKKY